MRVRQNSRAGALRRSPQALVALIDCLCIYILSDYHCSDSRASNLTKQVGGGGQRGRAREPRLPEFPVHAHYTKTKILIKNNK